MRHQSCFSRTRIFALALLVGAAFAAQTGCAPARRVTPREPGYSEKGIASWYGKAFHGRRTASGEPFDMYKLTAAHRTLPFGTIVRVRNTANGRTAVVRINDRGPARRDRILDVSFAAARQLDMIQAGIVTVELTVLEAP
ncbi:septal ring lytic transglycosylase RlpA family protein [bacterium]|nr:septal ring lytic transglycosylase RlpA family protein [bacterium]